MSSPSFGAGNAGSGDVVLRLGHTGQPVSDVATVGRNYSDGYYGGGVSVFDLGVSGTRAAYSAEAWNSAKAKYTGDGTVSTEAAVIDLGSRAVHKVRICGEFGGAATALAGTALATIGCHRLIIGVACQPLTPPQASDRCAIRAVARVNGRRIGTLRRTLRARQASLRFRPSRRLRSRPRRIVLVVTNTMRGVTETTRATLRPAYARR